MVLKTDKNPNTREHSRIDTVFKVSYRDAKRLIDYTENISESGVFIATENEFASGQKIVFELSFPGLFKPIFLNGEVIWRRPPSPTGLDPAKPPGIGVRLHFANDLERNWLRDLLQKLKGPKEGETKESSSQRTMAYSVLLSEDNPMTRAMFIGALEKTEDSSRLKIQVLQAEDEEQTWSTMQKKRIDLLIIEWRLCQKEEYGLLKKIRSNPLTAKIAIVVIGSKSEEQESALHAGADVFLRRPIPAKGLMNTVCILLSKRS